MRESCTSGSVRGARGNSRPYRNALLRSGTKEPLRRTAGGSAYRDAAEAYLRGAGPPPLTHWLPSEREVATDCAIQTW